MHNFIEKLISAGPVLTDGAWGTQLQERRLPLGACPDAWNLSQPDRVEQVARAYVEAGSRVIITNTFGANRFILERHGLADDVSRINRAGVEISRRAADARASVFASMGPSGVMLMMGQASEDELKAAFAVQATAMAEAGADAIVVETMSDPAEAVLAVRAACETGLPVVACMTFDSGPASDRTMMGTTVEQAAGQLAEAGADVVGSNCGQGIEGFADICRRMRAAADRPVWIKANAGLPEVADGETVYRQTPQGFADCVPRLVQAGAAFIGGCCGTTPEFVAAVREKLHAWNPRQRVLCAIGHQPPDRVPIDVGGTRQSGIAASTYHRLKARLGLHTPTRVYDVYQMLAEIERPVMERFGADVIGLNRPAVAFGIRNESFKPWRLPDGTPVEVPGGFDPEAQRNGDLLLRDSSGRPIARMPKDGFYFDRVDKYPGAAHVEPDSFQPPLLTAEECDHLHARAEAYHENTDLAIITALGPPYELFFGLGTGDFQSWMLTLATEPEYVHRLYERLTEAWLENLRRLHDAVGDRVQILQFNDDLGTQDAPFLSPAMFRELVFPYYKRGLDWVHLNTPWKVFMHNDGAIYDFISMLIEMGVDILNPVQTTARGMDPVKLKSEFGDRLVFWGAACDCQKTLPFGTPDEVAREVEQNIRVFAPGGGYVLTSVHNIQAGVPPENVIALFDAARGP